VTLNQSISYKHNLDQSFFKKGWGALMGQMHLLGWIWYWYINILINSH